MDLTSKIRPMTKKEPSVKYPFVETRLAANGFHSLLCKQSRKLTEVLQNFATTSGFCLWFNDGIFMESICLECWLLEKL